MVEVLVNFKPVLNQGEADAVRAVAIMLRGIQSVDGKADRYAVAIAVLDELLNDAGPIESRAEDCWQFICSASKREINH